MRIEKAQAFAKLVRLLHRLGLASYANADRFIDHLQVMVFEYESGQGKDHSDGSESL